jgi:hypothetical protein
MGEMNKSKCETNYSVDGSTDTAALELEYEGKAKLTITSESNGTYTIEICYKKQMKPKRKFKNGTYTE